MYYYSMAAILLFLFLIIYAIVVVTAQQTIRRSNISLDSSLTPTANSSWLSPSGLYAFGFFPQNNHGYALGVFIAGISENTPLIASASMFDNGNFVLYDSNSRVAWQSFDNPTDTLLPGQRLSPGQELVSSASQTNPSKGSFRLKMQHDGNLVQYPVNTPDAPPHAYYASKTNAMGSNVSLHLENDGHLYLFNGPSTSNITRGGYPIARTVYLMRIDVDGIFRLYSRSLDRGGNWTVRWSSTNDVCVPKGTCGINGFCVQIDQTVDCRCLPEFVSVQSGNWTAGCARNFLAGGGCGEKDSSVKYEIRRVENTVWEDNSYATLDITTEEDCRQACLSDCNCEAAFLNNRQCSKQKLPLRYGRRSPNNSYTALVKVSIGSGSLVKEIKKGQRLDILIIGISLIVVAVFVLAISVTYVRRKQRPYKRITDYREANLVEDVALRAFTYADLVRATNNFEEELGKGASGTVYKGILQNGQKVVAVKRLEKELTEGEREFQTEMKTIGKTYHRNLVRLLGYCLDGVHRLLVLEYMSNGSLADVLFKLENRPSWEERIKLARDIARGILYLHEECETQIIHCDIKPQNILMDENGRAKISDFGLAKHLKQDQNNTFTGIRGTKGYVAPEWHQKQAVSVKADVYSFGIVLLEIICCRRSVELGLSEDEAILEEWVYNCYEAGEISKLVADEEVDKRKLERMVKIGIWCIQNESSHRPSMKKVLLMLEGTVDIPVPPSPTPFLSSL
ncbi:hypothetical protein BUALT_Bualt11G0080300 [Buddleja alternifolia]|uniref:Receptor-like serine/threonine-protein kinase n=1 Tax=Buddleja alternifolia TaxID=168488 RepID=A0AAV6WV57_9LAMI|nr:hypothetical protein BUALT_Bualt11G0080300 [Buddleja alternifolia]